MSNNYNVKQNKVKSADVYNMETHWRTIVQKFNADLTWNKNLTQSTKLH